MYASASRSFQEARELLAHVKSARGYFHVVGIGAFDGLAQPPLIASLQSFVAKARRARGTSPNLGTHGVLPKPSTSCSESRPPMSKKRPTEIAETRGGHITLLVFVLISACCVDLLDIVHQNVPTKEN